MAVAPGSILDLSCWKITLPSGSKGKPAEVLQPGLSAFVDTQFFHATDDGMLVVFRAPVNGVTTSGSSNPRSELREMKPDGRTEAKWSAKSGYHRLTWTEAFTRLPNKRSEGNAGVVGAQIHDPSNDITVFRCEASGLYVTKGNNTHYKLVDPHYELGTPYRGRFDVSKGEISVFYNDTQVATIPCKGSSLYFKVGCYTQANSSNSKPADSTNYGEVAVSAVSVLHSTTPLPPPL